MNHRDLLWDLQRHLGDQVSRDRCAQITANWLNRQHKWPRKPNLDSVKIAKTLQQDGYVKIRNIFSQKEMVNIYKHLSNKGLHEFYNKNNRFIKPPSNIALAEVDHKVTLACPHLMGAVLSPRVVGVVEAFLGTVPILSHVGLMWSYPQSTPPINMQRWHRDRVDFKFCKMFVYLTDVLGPEHGPHMLVAGSNKGTRITKGGRYSDQEVTEAYTAEKQISLLGPAGSTWLSDTYQIHRGLPPTLKPRLLLQVEYCIVPPQGRVKYQPVRVRTKLNSKQRYIVRKAWR